MAVPQLFAPARGGSRLARRGYRVVGRIRSCCHSICIARRVAAHAGGRGVVVVARACGVVRCNQLRVHSGSRYVPREWDRAREGRCEQRMLGIGSQYLGPVETGERAQEHIDRLRGGQAALGWRASLGRCALLGLHRSATRRLQRPNCSQLI
eukprot:scaffold71316_cov25-Tisochrysis_lutea.AAC.4